MMQNRNYFDQFDDEQTAPRRIQGPARTPPPQTAAQAQYDQGQVAAQNRDAQLDNIRLQREIEDLRRMRGKPPESQTTGFDQTGKLYDDYRQSPAVKSYSNALPSYESALRAPNTPEGDLLRVYSYAKIMDPDSVVREGEAASVGASSPMIESIVARAKKEFGLPDGGQFSPEARERLQDAMRARMSSYNNAYIAARGGFRQRAEAFGLDPNLVIGEHAGVPFQQAEAQFLGRPVRQLDAEGNVVDPSKFTDEQVRVELERRLKSNEPTQDTIDWLYSIGRPPTANNAENIGLNRGYQHPDVRPGESTGLGIVQGLLHPIDRAAEGAQNATNWLLGTDFNSATESSKAINDYFKGRTTQGGQMLGNMVGTAAATARLPVTLGGAVAGLLSGNSDTAGTMLRDAGVGAITAKGVDLGLRGVAGLLAPRLDGSVRAIGQEVDSLTPAMLTGSKTLRNLEERATSLPVAGPRILEMREGAKAGAARATYKRAFAAAGLPVPKEIPAGHEGVKMVEQALSDNYGNILNRISVGLDRTFQNRMAATVARARLRPQEKAELAEIFEREVGGAFAGGQPLNGRSYKMLDERLNDLAGGFKRSDDPYRRQLGNAVQTVKDQLRATVRRQNPGAAEALRRADAGWAVYTRIRTAAAKAPATGIPTPNQFLTAVREGDRTVGKGATAKGDALLQDFGKNADDVMTRALGDSGTSDRESLTSAKAWLAGTLLSPLYNPRLVQGAQNLMLAPRNPTAELVAGTLRRFPAPALGGLFPGMLPAPQGN